jgi:hypothetical protein
VHIISLLSHFHLEINFAIIFESLLNYSVLVMEIPDMEYFLLVCDWPHSDWTKSLVCKDTI